MYSHWLRRAGASWARSWSSGWWRGRSTPRSAGRRRRRGRPRRTGGRAAPPRRTCCAPPSWATRWSTCASTRPIYDANTNNQGGLPVSNHEFCHTPQKILGIGCMKSKVVVRFSLPFRNNVHWGSTKVQVINKINIPNTSTWYFWCYFDK